METPSATLEKKPLPLPSDLYIEEDGSAQTTKFRKMLRDSFLSESDSSNSNSPCPKKMLRHADVYRNLIDFTKEDSTDDSGCSTSKSENGAMTMTSTFAKYSQDAIRRMGLQLPDDSSKESNSSENQEPMNDKQLEIQTGNCEEKNYEAGKIATRGSRKFQTCGADLEKGVEKKLNSLVLGSDSDPENEDNEKNINDSIEEIPFRHLIFSPNCKLSKEEILRFLLKVKKGLNYSLFSLKPPSNSFISLKKLDIINFPNPKKDKKTLVLDLDDTLITSNCAMDDRNAIPITLVDDDGNEANTQIKLRPYLKEFLESMSQYYEIIVFTAATMLWANTIISKIDPNGQFIKYILHRDNCLRTKNGLVIKDLRIIDRDLKDVVIVDDLVQNFGFQIDNGIPILAYNGNDEDDELRYLGKYLEKIAKIDDVRVANRNHLKLRNLLKTDIEKA